MNWYTGNIAEAVAEYKARDAIFVVYIKGEDEMSAKLDRFLGDSRVNSKLMSSDFVAVKIQGESPTYQQFVALYKLAPVPSIFFIGKSGTPLDVTTGIIESVEQLVVKIDKVLLLAGKLSNPEASTSKPVAIATNEVERSIAGAEEKRTSQEDQEAEVNTEVVAEVENASEESTSGAAAPEAIETPELFDVPEIIDAPKATEAPEAIDAPEGIDMPKPNDSSQTIVSPPPVASSPPAAAAVASSAAAAAEKRAAASAAAAATTSSMLPNAVASLLPSVPLVPTTTTTTPPQADSVRSTADVDIQQLVEQKKLERQEEQQRRDKENELRRRREGRDAQVQQAQAREQELKSMQERIRRERQQEQETRDRILAQIAADRAEQANRAEAQSNNTLSTTTNTVTSPDSSISSAVDETRLQIRLPGGITRTKAFPIEEPLSTVRVYVLNELLVGSSIRDFTLATSYPRREFQADDELKTLIDLNLVPNAVLLVLKREQVNSVVRTSNNLFNILSSVFWAILTPAAMAFDYLNKMGLQRIRQRFMQMVSNVGLVKSPGRTIADNGGASAQDASARRNMGLFANSSRESPGLPDSTSDDATSTQSGEPQYQPPPMIFSEGAISQQAAQQRSGGAYRRYGESNIRRLADTTKDEDDKATYNGNSTQQQ